MPAKPKRAWTSAPQEAISNLPRLGPQRVKAWGLRHGTVDVTQVLLKLAHHGLADVCGRQLGAPAHGTIHLQDLSFILPANFRAHNQRHRVVVASNELHIDRQVELRLLLLLALVELCVSFSGGSSLEGSACEGAAAGLFNGGFNREALASGGSHGTSVP